MARTRLTGWIAGGLLDRAAIYRLLQSLHPIFGYNSTLKRIANAGWAPILCGGGNIFVLSSTQLHEPDMSITRLHHVNICTDDVAASARYYAEVFDLEARNAPGPYPADMVRWMYNQNDQPVIHLFKQKRESGSTGVIHHVALDCVGRDKIRARLDRLGTKYQTRQDETGTIIFMQDPHGVMLELYFPGE